MLFTVIRNIYSTQTKMSWFFVQVGYTGLGVNRKTQANRALVELHLFAPRQTRNSKGETMGYVRKGFYLRIGNFHLGSRS